MVVTAAATTILREGGYHVVTAYSAEEGLRKCSKVRPDLVVLDIGMPGMSGVQVLRQLVGEDGATSIPVLIFTALPTLVDEHVRSLADGFLVKPADGETLLAEVGRILATRGEA